MHTIHIQFAMDVDDAVRARDALETLVLAHGVSNDRTYSLVNFVLTMFDKALDNPPAPPCLRDAAEALAEEEKKDPMGVQKRILETAALVRRAKELGALP